MEGKAGPTAYGLRRDRWRGRLDLRAVAKDTCRLRQRWPTYQLSAAWSTWKAGTAHRRHHGCGVPRICGPFFPAARPRLHRHLVEDLTAMSHYITNLPPLFSSSKAQTSSRKVANIRGHGIN